MTKDKARGIVASMLARDIANAEALASDMPQLSECCDNSIRLAREVAKALNISEYVQLKLDAHWR